MTIAILTIASIFGLVLIVILNQLADAHETRIRARAFESFAHQYPRKTARELAGIGRPNTATADAND